MKGKHAFMLQHLDRTSVVVVAIVQVNMQSVHACVTT